MIATRLPLLINGERLIMLGARPFAIKLRCGVQATAARHLRGLRAVARCMVVAKTALMPCGIVADAPRRRVGKDHPASLLKQRRVCLFIKPKALGVDLVVVLAHENVHSTGQAKLAHVALRLCPVFRVHLTHAIALHLGKLLDVAGLHVHQMRGFRGFG